MKTLYTNITIKPVSKDTIARADDVFYYIDSDFENYGTDKKSLKAEETKMAVLEMEKDGTFEEIFNSISKNTDSLCLTQAQIIEFAKTEKDKLRDGGYATFFLFKVGETFFVADVHVNDGELEVGARQLSSDNVWSAEYRRRIVVPQLALGNSVSLTPGTSATLILPDTLEINGVTYKKVIKL